MEVNFGFPVVAITLVAFPLEQSIEDISILRLI